MLTSFPSADARVLSQILFALLDALENSKSGKGIEKQVATRLARALSNEDSVAFAGRPKDLADWLLARSGARAAMTELQTGNTKRVTRRPSHGRRG